MRILVLGATGRTGAEIVGQAVAAGHQVRALVRDPAKLGSAPAQAVTGDATRPGRGGPRRRRRRSRTRRARAGP
jgi:uncharacterized protein YbjT (DUF2867 family)